MLIGKERRGREEEEGGAAREETAGRERGRQVTCREGGQRLLHWDRLQASVTPECLRGCVHGMPFKTITILCPGLGLTER